MYSSSPTRIFKFILNFLNVRYTMISGVQYNYTENIIVW